MATNRNKETKNYESSSELRVLSISQDDKMTRVYMAIKPSVSLESLISNIREERNRVKEMENYLKTI